MVFDRIFAMPTNLMRGYLRLHGTPFSFVGFFCKIRSKGVVSVNKNTIFMFLYVKVQLFWLRMKKKLDGKVVTFFLTWVFEVVNLVKLWENCSGVVEIPVCEVPVVDSVVAGHGIMC